MLQASARAIMPASSTPGEEAWISLIGSPGNMQVSGFKGREPVSEEVAARTVNVIDGFTLPVSHTVGGGSEAAGIIVADGLLRLPLDEFWPTVHLAPYIFAGFGGILLGTQGVSPTVSESFTVTNNATGQTKVVNVTGRGVSRLSQNLGSDRVLGHVGLGLEYRFTPHIGLFSEAGYVFPDGASNNFVQVNFGLRYAF